MHYTASTIASNQSLALSENQPVHDDLSARLRAACNPTFDTACHRKAVDQWHELFAYNGERVDFLQMTLDQRMWVNARAQQLKEEGQ